MFNNPYRYTDPTGNLGVEERQWLGAIITIAAAFTGQYWAAGATTVAGGNAIMLGTMAVGGFAGGAVATQSLRGGLMGAYFAVATAGIGGIGGGSGGFGAWALQTAAGGVLGTLQGGNFGHSLLSAGLTSGVMPHVGTISSNAARTITGAMVGGTISRVTGGKFANGAVSGAIQAAMSRVRGRSSYSSPDGGRSAEGLTPNQFEELQGEFDALEPQLSAIRARSPRATADAFADLALPFTKKWGFEIGANITGGGGAFQIEDVALGIFGTVVIRDNLAAVANVQTHPAGGAAGFSGNVTITKSRGFRRDIGDLDTNFDRNIDGYAYQVRGGAWRFNQSAFRTDLAGAQKTGSEIAASWSRYVERIR